MTTTTTTPSPARGGVRQKSCQHCGNGFTPKSSSQKYCDDECSYGAGLRKQRLRDSKRNYKNRVPSTMGEVAVATPRAAVAPPVSTKRAATLAETEDTPAVNAARGDYLTGGAAATMQATSGGRIGVV